MRGVSNHEAPNCRDEIMREPLDLFFGKWREIADDGSGRREARKLRRQRCGIIDREKQRIRAGLFAMH